MFGKSLVLVFLVGLAVAEPPAYLKICGRRNPNLDQCVLESVEGLRGKLREGMAELDVPSLEPLTMDELPLINTDAIKTVASNVKIHGLTDFKLRKVHIDLEKQVLETVTVFDKVILDADYEVNAKIVVPIVRKGPVHIVADELVSTGTTKWKMEKKNGVDYIYFSSATTQLTIKDYSVDFQNSDDPNSPMAQALSAALEGGRQEILEAIRPNLEKVISAEVLKRANKVAVHFSYDELFPDRE